MAEEPELQSLAEVNPRDLDDVVKTIQKMARIGGADRETEYERHAWGFATFVAAVGVVFSYGNPESVQELTIGATFLGALATWRAFNNRSARMGKMRRLQDQLYRDIGKLSYRFGW